MGMCVARIRRDVTHHTHGKVDVPVVFLVFFIMWVRMCVFRVKSCAGL